MNDIAQLLFVHVDASAASCALRKTFRRVGAAAAAAAVAAAAAAVAGGGAVIIFCRLLAISSPFDSRRDSATLKASVN